MLTPQALLPLGSLAGDMGACHMCVCVCKTGPLPTDFPDSRPAVEDLKYCLERTDQRQQLLASLKSALETRLLHPGPAADRRPPSGPRARSRAWGRG